MKTADILPFRQKNQPLYFYKVRYQFKGYDSATVLSCSTPNPEAARNEFVKVLPEGAVVFVPEFKYASR